MCIPLALGACLQATPRDAHQGQAHQGKVAPSRMRTRLPPPPATLDPDTSTAGARVSESSSDLNAPSTWGVPSDTTTPAAGPPPLSGDFEPLPIAGYPEAWMSLPTGATSRRPVVVVIHGAGDRPERQCRGWRHATNEYPFVVCPRGLISPAYTHLGGAPLLEYIDGALEALAARYRDYADTGNPLLAGFSLGAKQVTELAVQFPERFPRVALVEGATRVWSLERAEAFVQGGGQRVLFGCGQGGVRNSAERTAKRLEGIGLDAHVVFANVGHRFAPSLQEAVHAELAWLMEGDERWSATP
jgi:pimeloyl-ACP methyl ester carboxylesterase